MAIINNILVGIIRVYQQVFSRQPQVRCKYFPSCSEYTVLAIRKHGFVIGTAKGLCRIVRCNPFSKGGLDLP